MKNGINLIAHKFIQENGTPPEDDPTPSIGIDIKNWHEITKKARFEQECLYFVIVGRKKPVMGVKQNITTIG